MDIPNLGFPLEEEESAVKKRRLETTGVHVTEGEQEGTAHVTEGEQEGVTDAVTMAEGCVAKVKRTNAYKRRKLVRPTLSSCAMYTAQPRKNIPGHTGYLTFATLHAKQKRSSATDEPTALACAC